MTQFIEDSLQELAMEVASHHKGIETCSWREQIDALRMVYRAMRHANDELHEQLKRFNRATYSMDLGRNETFYQCGESSSLRYRERP